MKTEEILKLLTLLKSKESMVTGRKLTVHELKCFLDGLILGIGISAISISLWLRKKYGTEINIGWSDYVLDKNSNGSDDEIKIILIQELEEYISKNPDFISN
jgi:hypothetical protein